MRRKSTRRSRRSRHSRSRRNHNSRRWMTAGFIAIPSLVIGGGIAAITHQMEKEKIDPSTYCYSRADQYQSAFFIDFSLLNDISEAQDRSLETALRRAYEELPPNGKISIFTTARDKYQSLANPALVQCRPASTPAEQERILTPEQTRPQLSRRAEESQKAYMKALSSLMNDAKDKTKTAKDSPILEQIKAISVYYNRYYPNTLKRFHVFSDGIQNTNLRQFCVTKGHLPPFRKFAQNNDYKYVKPNGLTGVDVSFYLTEFGTLPTAGMPYCTNKELRNFWKAFFEEATGVSAELTPMRYGASD